jgi:hypothetical protein
VTRQLRAVVTTVDSVIDRSSPAAKSTARPVTEQAAVPEFGTVQSAVFVVAFLRTESATVALGAASQMT